MNRLWQKGLEGIVRVVDRSFGDTLDRQERQIVDRERSEFLTARLAVRLSELSGQHLRMGLLNGAMGWKRRDGSSTTFGMRVSVGSHVPSYWAEQMPVAEQLELYLKDFIEEMTDCTGAAWPQHGAVLHIEEAADGALEATIWGADGGVLIDVLRIEAEDYR